MPLPSSFHALFIPLPLNLWVALQLDRITVKHIGNSESRNCLFHFTGEEAEALRQERHRKSQHRPRWSEVTRSRPSPAPPPPDPFLSPALVHTSHCPPDLPVAVVTSSSGAVSQAWLINIRAGTKAKHCAHPSLQSAKAASSTPESKESC